jgi:hypothetical protein
MIRFIFLSIIQPSGRRARKSVPCHSTDYTLQPLAGRGAVAATRAMTNTVETSESRSMTQFSEYCLQVMQALGGIRPFIQLCCLSAPDIMATVTTYLDQTDHLIAQSSTDVCLHARSESEFTCVYVCVKVCVSNNRSIILG